MTDSTADLERRYAYVLATMSPQALAELHAGALARMSSEHRTAVLRAVQEGLGTGTRVTADNTSALGRLVAHGNRLTPEPFSNACPKDIRQDLIEAVIAHVGPRHWDSYASWSPPVQHADTFAALTPAVVGDSRSEVRALAASHAMAANASGTV